MTACRMDPGAPFLCLQRKNMLWICVEARGQSSVGHHECSHSWLSEIDWNPIESSLQDLFGKKVTRDANASTTLQRSTSLLDGTIAFKEQGKGHCC